MSINQLVNGQMTIRAVMPESVSVKNEKLAYAVVDGQECMVVSGVNGGSVVDCIEKAKFIPDADETQKEKVYLFVGLTNTKYEHGHIYECQKTATYTSVVSFEPSTISVSGSDFANFCDSVYVDAEAITNGSMTYFENANLWRFVGKNDEGTQLFSYQQYQEDFEDAGFTFTGTPKDGDVVEFECSIVEESATYSWVDINK